MGKIKIFVSITVMALYILSPAGLSPVMAELQGESAPILNAGPRDVAPHAAVSDKISLDLKGMDVVEVIKMLATKGNLNVGLSADVKGRVTIFLKSVEVMDALDIILAANGLAYDRRGDIIYVMSQREYEAIYGEKYADRKEAKIFQLKYAKASDAAKALNQMRTKIGKIVTDDGSNTIVVIDSPQTIAQITAAVSKMDMPTVTKVFELKYAKAADLKTKITETMTKGIGTMQIDERTNKVSVTDLEKKMGEIEKLVAAFDDKLQQVLIEAKIVQVTLSDQYKLGVDWTSVITKVGQMGNDINISSMFQIAASNAFGPPGAQILIGALSDSDWATMIQVLKTVGDTDLLSSPRITALNNQEAKILVGKSQPYATNTVTQTTGLATTATNLAFIDIGVKLFVTPTINKDGFITMKIKPEVSSSTTFYHYGTPDTTVPIVETTQAETSVTVKDGTTIIIGGLIKDQRTNSVSKVPFLGDIPIIGQAFRKTETTVEKQELVVFLTPHIVTGEYDMLEQPKTYPIGEKDFTMPEKPTFERRRPEEMDPGMFKKSKQPAVNKNKGSSKKVAINTPEDYFYAVREKILGNMKVPRPSGGSAKGSVRVTFILSPNGSIALMPQVLESTNRMLDEAALSAVKKAAPFPAFPQSLGSAAKRFNIDISTE